MDTLTDAVTGGEHYKLETYFNLKSSCLRVQILEGINVVVVVGGGVQNGAPRPLSSLIFLVQ